MQVFSIDQTNLSQPCPANSQQYGGTDQPISVGKLTNFSQYTACLPNFLTFDSNVLKKVVYQEEFLCPAVRWNRQIADDGTLNAPEIMIPVRKQPAQLAVDNHLDHASCTSRSVSPVLPVLPVLFRGSTIHCLHELPITMPLVTMAWLRP